MGQFTVVHSVTMHSRGRKTKALEDEDARRHALSLREEEAARRRHFLTSLELEDASIPVGKDQRYVNNGSLVSFASSLTGQQKQDVLDSTLLAQLAANKKHNRADDFKNWYNFYTKVMSNVGWVVQDFKFNDYHSSQAEFKLSQVTLEILSALVGGEAEILAVVKSTLDGLAKSTKGVTLFSDSSTKGKNGNFQIVPCTVDESNQVNVAFMGFTFEASRRADDFFFFTWESQDIKLFYSTQSCTLNEEIYAQVRGDVRKKVVKYIKSNIDNLDVDSE